MSIKLLKIALILFFISYNNTYSQDKEYHIVEKGETFYSISKKFNKSIEELNSKTIEELITDRHAKYQNIGTWNNER